VLAGSGRAASVSVRRNRLVREELAARIAARRQLWTAVMAGARQRRNRRLHRSRVPGSVPGRDPAERLVALRMVAASPPTTPRPTDSGSSSAWCASWLDRIDTRAGSLLDPTTTVDEMGSACGVFGPCGAPAAIRAFLGIDKLPRAMWISRIGRDLDFENGSMRLRTLDLPGDGGETDRDGPRLAQVSKRLSSLPGG